MNLQQIKAKPILFSTEMVQAILAGRKSQTRRIAKGVTFNNGFEHTSDSEHNFHFGEVQHFIEKFAKYQVGNILWVRETWSQGFIENGKHTGIRYKADDVDYKVKWKPSIFLQREDARIYLKVTSVRIERLNDISEDDAIAEGVSISSEGGRAYLDYIAQKYHTTQFIYNKRTAKESYQTLRDLIYGIHAWYKNPYVWVYEFEIIN